MNEKLDQLTHLELFKSLLVEMKVSFSIREDIGWTYINIGTQSWIFGISGQYIKIECRELEGDFHA